MTCIQCSSPIASPKISGELCTKCFFEAKREANPAKVESEPSLVVNPAPPAQSERSIVTREEKKPTVSVDRQLPNKDVKYCQSCIERGYGLKLATREFRPGEFICDDCFGPILDNTLGYQVERAEIERVIPQVDYDKPLLEQFYSLLNIPQPLRYTQSEHVLRHRNDIFNYHAVALVNKTQDEVIAEIEQMQVMLFQIKISLEPLTDYINKEKERARAEKNLKGLEKSKAEVTKGTPRTSKVKLSQEQKMADAMFKMIEPDAEKRLKMYQEMAKKAREQEFNKITGN